ncbi:hypothetical protein Tco_0453206 [Tanacetum coccineum]
MSTEAASSKKDISAQDLTYFSFGLALLFSVPSSVREVGLLTGKVKALQDMDYSYFGEGLTLLGDRRVNLPVDIAVQMQASIQESGLQEKSR